jgi:hypothetical protein
MALAEFYFKSSKRTKSKYKIANRNIQFTKGTSITKI